MNSSFSLLTYNIQASIFKSNAKLKQILYHILNEEFDIVTLQGMKSESSRRRFTNVLMKEYKTLANRYNIDTFPQKYLEDSGLLTASKFAKKSLSKLKLNYHNNEGSLFDVLKKKLSFSFDFFSNKSVTVTLLQLDSEKHVLMFNTHVTGSKELILLQLKQIKNFIHRITDEVIASNTVSARNLSVVLSGSFNIDAYTTKAFNEMMVTLETPRDLHREYHGATVHYSWTTKKPSKRFDYIFSYDTISEHTLNKVSINSIEVCEVKYSDKHLSNHFPLKTTLSY